MASETKKWFQSKLTWLGLGMGVLGALTAWLESSPLDPMIVGAVTSVIGVAVAYLRRVTTTAIE